ncbi:thioredoxin domain-containing protein [Sphingomonas solaris]|uniref:Protein-disulfide isomerase n=1 Tax=Alterirhizorhabdus solaris TaxID=2529389 RepID=A0A558QT60_9SPHN|nr:thioredoxin domain-containing protein [Sphingomonas solaris]TVV70304.1 protein-disulfide isomerase [Sphingomonas solaris]
MRFDPRWALAAIALTVAGCDKKPAEAPAAGGTGNTAAAAGQTPAGQDWTQTVTLTPEGGFRMGNPDAPVKLVEYASLTCPHCAAFAKEGAGALQADYVRAGKVSWEYRTFVLNSIDVAASLLARCQGPAPFFKLVEQVYANQESWVGNFQNLSDADQKRIAALPEDQQFAALAKAGGLDTFFGSRGLPAGKAQACLTDKDGLAKVIAIREMGTNQDKITGTPSFLVNGTLAEGAFDWASLKQKLDAALAG